jgi:hypothetical protein
MRRVYHFLIKRDGARLMFIVISLASALSVAAFFGSLHYAKVAKSGIKSELTVDQELAALSTNITILGGIVAVAAIGIAIGALFGYAELRTATMRKTEDNLVKLIKEMQKSGELSDATTAVLMESVVPERVIVLRVPADEAKTTPIESNETGQTESPIAEEYPGDSDDNADR